MERVDLDATLFWLLRVLLYPNFQPDNKNYDKKSSAFLVDAQRAYLTVTNVAQMISDCSGIICLCITDEAAKKLSLPPMIGENTNRFQTAFTVSIEATEGITTGVSAYDRWKTIKTAIDPNSKPSDLKMPGHVFPLVTKKNGVLERRGHTEGSIDLLKIAKIEPFAVLCEIMNKDGTMKRLPELLRYAKRHCFPITTIEDLYQYRLSKTEVKLSSSQSKQLV